MKIDIVSENASPLPGAAGRHSSMQSVHVRQLALALGRRDHDVTVWTRRDAPDLPDTVLLSDAVEVQHLDAGPALVLPERELLPYLPALADALRSAWGRARPDVVHAHFWTSGMVSVGAARELGVPTVQTFHSLASVAGGYRGTAEGGPGGRFRAERGVAQVVDRSIATSIGQAGELIRLGVRRRGIRVVPHGVDAEEFCPEGPALPRSHRFRVVHAGRLLQRRGVDEAVAALAPVPQAELVVAGDFGPGDRDRIRLQALAERYRVGHRLNLIGPLPRDRVPELLRSADVVVCVPWFEQFGVVALEAMACARPVVASAVGGLADTVVDGVTGTHVPPRRASALVAALRGLLGQPTMNQAFGVAGRDRAVARYSWDRIADTTADVYREIAQG